MRDPIRNYPIQYLKLIELFGLYRGLSTFHAALG